MSIEIYYSLTDDFGSFISIGISKFLSESIPLYYSRFKVLANTKNSKLTVEPPYILLLIKISLLGPNIYIKLDMIKYPNPQPNKNNF